MTLQTLLEQKGITKYRLSQISGVPKTTILDLCAGRTSIETCSVKTVSLIARAIDCTIEDLLRLDSPSEYDEETGLPNDNAYLECGLPPYLQESLEDMKKSWARIDRGEKDMRWDCYWCSLSADINSAEVDRRITSEQANYLRREYLRIEVGVI